MPSESTTASMRLLLPSQYQARASSAYASVVEELSPAMPHARFEHVGASSIPGAISKGDLDICVLVSPSRHQSTIETLETLGHVIKADTLRTAELCMLVSPRQDLDIALHVVAQGSRFEFFLHFRDALRANPALVLQYNQLKQRVASQAPERYRDKKDQFIQAVLERI